MYEKYIKEALPYYNPDGLKIDSANKISLLAKEYISSIDEGEEHVFYGLELESGHLIPKLVL